MDLFVGRTEVHVACLLPILLLECPGLDLLARDMEIEVHDETQGLCMALPD
jgi:hypothetical protein